MYISGDNCIAFFEIQLRLMVTFLRFAFEQTIYKLPVLLVEYGITLHYHLLPVICHGGY